MKRCAVALLLCLSCICADKPAGYRNDFEKAEIGKIPGEFMILAGSFAVAQVEEKNKALELAGEPLDASGFLFGPASPGGVEVSARIWGRSTGRRFPEFAIGASDAGGHKLWVLPGQARIELRKGDVTQTSASYRAWKPGTWTRLRLRVTRGDGGKWNVQGKAWPDGAAEPAAWTLALEDAPAPVGGRASAWGTPISGQPIRFDDLGVTPLP